MSGISRPPGEAQTALQLPHHVSAMTLALSLGRRGLGTCWPNPSVGVVVADSLSGRIISCAWTARGGRPHAEAIALAAAGEAARGSTVYTTLEPCSHWGKTPPCADALVAAGIRRLVYGAVDPDPRVAGKGLARLRSHGVEVIEGPFPQAARWLAIGHSLRVSRGRPFVQLKLAVDVDGLIPAGDGAPQFVTGEEARGLAHLVRAEADAILVGRGTVEADDAELTCRLPGLADRSPVRVVLSRQARLPRQARMLRSIATYPIWLICAADAPAEDRAELERLGVVVIPVRTGAGDPTDMEIAMRALAERGITRVLVEGGPQIAASCLAADLIDEALIFEAAIRSQGKAIRLFAPVGISAVKQRENLGLYGERLIGRDRLSVYRRAEFC